MHVPLFYDSGALGKNKRIYYVGRKGFLSIKRLGLGIKQKNETRVPETPQAHNFDSRQQQDKSNLPIDRSEAAISSLRWLEPEAMNCTRNSRVS